MLKILRIVIVEYLWRGVPNTLKAMMFLVFSLTLLPFGLLLLFAWMLSPDHQEPISDQVLIEFLANNRNELEEFAHDNMTGTGLMFFLTQPERNADIPESHPLRQFAQSLSNIQVSEVGLGQDYFTLQFGDITSWLTYGHSKSLVYWPNGIKTYASYEVSDIDTHEYLEQNSARLINDEHDGYTIYRKVDSGWYISHWILYDRN